MEYGDLKTMAAITREQIKEIRTLTRRANRRIERATPGQRSALNYYVRKVTGANKFSASTKGLTQEQAAAKLRDLETFLNSPSSTRKGWDRIKKENIRKANETLSEEGYNLTDEELAEILEQIDTRNKKDYYKAINLVSAAKLEAGAGWEGSSEDIAEAIGEKVTYQEALERAILARNERNAKR